MSGNDVEKLQLRVVDVVLSYFDTNPNVHAETAGYIFRNLALLFRYLDDHVTRVIPITVPAADDTCPFAIPTSSTASVTGNISAGDGTTVTTTAVRRHFVGTINALACHNDSTVRTAMKSAGLFKIRDALIKDYRDLASFDGSGDGSNMSGSIDMFAL
jgi:hypothetical protein